MKDTNLLFSRPYIFKQQKKKKGEPSIVNYISTVKLLPVTCSKFLAVNVLSNPNTFHSLPLTVSN